MRIATFNVQNMRLRRDGGGRLDGARDGDVPEDEGAAARALDPIDRRLTAAVLRDVDADVVALQEVFDAGTLDFFHDTYLVDAGLRPYPHRVCLPGNDGRGLDVAVMSRRPLEPVASHATLTPEEAGLDPPEDWGGQPVFRRDCLEVGLGELTLFVCHFKAPWPDAEASWTVRRLEAETVRRIIETRFDDPQAALWLVAGDLNDPDPPGTPGRSVTPLDPPFSDDLGLRMPGAERWTYRNMETGDFLFPDALLASPRLAREQPGAVPWVVREGLSREVGRRGGARLAEVGEHRPHASDHAALVVEFAGL